MRYIPRYIILILSLFLFLACNGTKNSIPRQIKEYYGVQLKLPVKAAWRLLDKDTVIELKNRPKIITYYNSEGCFSCRMKELQSWKNLVEEIENESLDVDFVAIFKVNKENEEFIMNLFDNEFIYPLLCDSTGEFEKGNTIPENSLYHTFLVDENNCIQIIGIPIYNPKLWAIYKEKIKKLSSD